MKLLTTLLLAASLASAVTLRHGGTASLDAASAPLSTVGTEYSRVAVCAVEPRVKL